ncbi:MAG: riboflavin biosynthesis protein RibF [Alphaproteobacteria bacterium]|nr:riboflavin biosynthesis protein RibF [Alphaproteobacteria bacterium]
MTLSKKPFPYTGGVWALGNFDGVHLGHQAVLTKAKEEAQKRKTKAYVLTFEPHPYALFKKDEEPFRLTPPPVKERLLHESGMDGVVTLSFTPTFASKKPDAFVADSLMGGCQAEHVVVGFDFVFGSGRGGDRAALRRYLEPFGVAVTEEPPCRDKEGEIISSSRIRSLLRHGKVEKSAALLGRPFLFEGKVQKGQQRGRTLGFPTANFALGDLIRPRFGPYVALARQKGTDLWHQGVINIGKRPSVDGLTELAELYLFDFDKDIYGKAWEIQLLHFLRPEKAFENIAFLKEQIQADVAAAHKYFAMASFPAGDA